MAKHASAGFDTQTLAEEDFQKIANGMSSAKFAVGYHELDLPMTNDLGRVSVWLPLPQSYLATCEPVREYTATVHFANKIHAVTQGWVHTWLLCCIFPNFEVRMQAGQSGAVVQTPNRVLKGERRGPFAGLPRPKGCVLIAHGLGGSRLQFALHAEQLARRGIMVIAPDFDDSGNNTRSSLIARGNNLLGEHAIVRMHHLDVCREYASKRFGVTRFGLLGYSLGSATVRFMRLDVPKVYVGGPTIGRTAPLTPFEDPDIFPHEPPPECATLYLMSMGDALCPPPEQVATNIGPTVQHVDLTLSQLHASPLPLHSRHVFQTLGHEGLAWSEEFLKGADAQVGPFFSCGLAKVDPAVLDEVKRAERLVVPLVVRFFEQFL